MGFFYVSIGLLGSFGLCIGSVGRAWVYGYLGPSGIGTVSANETPSSLFFTSSVHKPQSVSPPSPSMTSGVGKGRGVFRLSLKVSGALAFGVTTGGTGGLSSGVASVASGRLNNFLNIVKAC